MKIFNAFIALGLVTGSANASDFSFTGKFDHDDQVQEFNLTVAEAAADVTLRTWSYAGGTNAQGTVIARGGFDPIVSLFNASTGAQIAVVDDGVFPTVPQDPDTGNASDSFLMENLPAGNYTATLTQFDSFPLGSLADGFSGSGHVDFASRDSYWALDVLNVDSASLGASYVSPIPEPESYALLLAGLGLITLVAMRRGNKFESRV
jgi:hypothetical protein